MSQHLFTLLATVILSAACAAPSQAQSGPHPEGSQTMIRVKARHAKKQGLPPIGFALDIGKTAMLASKFPEPGLYLTASGPPGGLLLLQVSGYRGEAHDQAALDAQIQARFSQPHHTPLVLHEAGTLRLSGADRVARSFMTGKHEMTRARWCAALVPSKTGAGEGLLVVIGEAAGPTDPVTCAAVAANRNLAPLVASFALE